MIEKVKVSDKVTAIAERNLDEKVVKETVELKSCEECRFYNKPWVWGGHLHCCSQDWDNTRSSRKVEDLFDNCPLGHKIEVTKYFIKQYGFIVEEDKWYESGYIAIVDFSPSHWESDGHNPDIEWHNIAVFYYDTEDEDAKEKMMELALECYEKLGLDGEFTKKRCFG